jgi:DNA-binding XRE family transcriptional regulator
MTQEALAEAAGVTRETIVALERGQKTPRQGTMEAVCMALEQRGIAFTNGGEPGVKLRAERTLEQSDG